MPSARFPSRKRTTINQERIAQSLEQAASNAENPPPSLKEVELRPGYQPTTVYKINRTACHTIAERFTAYRRELRERRRLFQIIRLQKSSITFFDSMVPTRT